MKYKTLFFDLDDTLIDTQANSKEALEEIYRKYEFCSYYENFNAFFQVYNKYNLSLWKKYEENRITKQELLSSRFFQPFRHIDGLTQDRGIYINEDYLSRVCDKENIIKGAHELLSALRPYFRIFVLSNGFEEVQYKKIKSARLENYFDDIILSDHAGVNKPATGFYEYALKKTMTNREETIMIGDNWNSDMWGAKNSGIDQLWYNPKKLPEQGFIPTHSVSSLLEIEDILLNTDSL